MKRAKIIHMRGKEEGCDRSGKNNYYPIGVQVVSNHGREGMDGLMLPCQLEKFVGKLDP